MSEVLKHLSLIGHVSIQHRLAVVLISAPENMVMSASNYLNGIELHETQTFEHLLKIDRSCGSFVQSLRGEQ